MVALPRREVGEVAAAGGEVGEGAAGDNGGGDEVAAGGGALGESAAGDNGGGDESAAGGGEVGESAAGGPKKKQKKRTPPPPPYAQAFADAAALHPLLVVFEEAAALLKEQRPRLIEATRCAAWMNHSDVHQRHVGGIVVDNPYVAARVMAAAKFDAALKLLA